MDNIIEEFKTGFIHQNEELQKEISENILQFLLNQKNAKLFEEINQDIQEYINDFKLIICGKFYDKSYLELVKKNITDDICKNVIIIDEYLSKDDYSFFISVSDYVLVVYKNFYFSSKI